MNVERIEELILTCQRESYDLSHAGNMNFSEIVRLVELKKNLRSLADELYEGRSLKEYLDRSEGWSTTFKDDEYSFYFVQEKPGIRFSEKSELFFCCDMHHEDAQYTITVPISNKNVQAELLGVVWTTEPTLALEGFEYAVFVRPTDSKNEKKFLFDFHDKRKEQKIPNKYSRVLLALEDAIIYGLSQFNLERFSEENEGCSKKIILLLNWSIARCDLLSQSYYKSIDIQMPKEFGAFSNFEKWCLAHGYIEGAKLEPKDQMFPATPNNYEWVPKEKVFPNIAYRLMEAAYRPTRYYHVYNTDQYKTFTEQWKTMATYQGVTKTLLEWSEESGLSVFILSQRNEQDDDNEDFLRPELIHKQRIVQTLINHQGVERTLEEWAEITGISKKTIISRIRYGWNEENLLDAPRKRNISE